MTVVKTGPRVVVSVVATDSGDWQVVGTPAGYQGILSTLFAENDFIHGFVTHSDGEQWEEYDHDDNDDTSLLQITSLTGTVIIARPATPYRSSKSDGSRMDAGSDTHTLAIDMGSGSLTRFFRENSPFIKTFTSGDATPSVEGYSKFKTAGTTNITRFDNMSDGSRFLVMRGASDITIVHDGTNISLFGATNVILTAASPAIEFVVEAGVAKQIVGTKGFASANFTSGDATPSVASGDWFVTAGTTAITDFDDASEGQLITIQRGASDIVITYDATKISLQGRVNRTLTLDDPRVTFRSVGGVWYEISTGALATKAPLAYTPSGAGSVTTTAENVMNAIYLAPERFGAVGDGTSNPVSEWITGGARDRGYANLAAITAHYSHVSSLSDEIDWAAITQTLAALGKCVLGDKDYYIGGNKLTVSASQRLEGSNPTSAIDGSVGSRITGALSSASVVAISGGGGNLPSVFRGVHVKRAAGSIPSGSEGVTVESGDNALIEDLYISHHARGFRVEGQLNTVVNRVCVADVTEAYFDIDSIEVTLSECRAGRNGLTSGSFGGHYVRIGANTDTLNVFSCVFAEPSGSASDCIFFSNYSNPNGIFNFTNCHWEAFSNFIVTNSTTTAQRLSITSCTATNASGAPNLIAGVDSPVGDIKRLRLTGSIFDGAGWVFELPTVTGEVTTCYFADTVLINAGAVAFTGNTVNGNINITGAHNGTSVVGNVMPGTFAIAEVSSPTGDFHYALNICDDAATNAAAIAIKTVGNIRSGGYLFAGSYVEATTYVKAASSLRSTVDIGAAWTLSDDAASFTLANGASKTLADGSGIVVVTETTAGKTAVFATGGANIEKIAGAAEWVVGSPGAGQMGLNWNGSTAYIITNNMGADRTFYAGGFRVRPAN